MSATHTLQTAPEGADLVRSLGWRCGRDVVLDPRGRTLRCTPRRRTVRHDPLPGFGLGFFRKLRSGSGSGGAARREWAALQQLSRLGLPVPVPICRAQWSGQSALVMSAVPGRPLDALVLELGEAAVLEFLRRELLPQLHRFHAAGWCHRDLYLGHLLARPEGGRLLSGPQWIDLERCFQPLPWRRWRYRLKDLAALVSSWPAARHPRRSEMCRLLRLTLGEEAGRWRSAWRRIARRVERNRRHVPRYGDAGWRPVATAADAAEAKDKVRSP